jgi:hypothetical protein
MTKSTYQAFFGLCVDSPHMLKHFHSISMIIEHVRMLIGVSEFLSQHSSCSKCTFRSDARRRVGVGACQIFPVILNDKFGDAK